MSTGSQYEPITEREMDDEVDSLRQRVSQLEQLNSLLAKQIDRQRPVIEAARRYLAEGDRQGLLNADAAYWVHMAQLAKESE